MVQNPSSHGRDWPWRTRPPPTMRHHPADLQAFLEASCVLGLPMSLPPIGRTAAAPRRLEGFQMIGVHLCGGQGLWGGGRFGRRRLLCRPFGTSLMPVGSCVLAPHFDALGPRLLWSSSLARA
jgi:hypothetical protein